MSAVLSPAQLVASLKWRYATKKFDPAFKIDDATWTALEESLVLTPSSYGIQPWKFFVVNTPAVREKLLPASYGQRQVVDASHLVIFTFRKDLDAAHLERYVARTAEVRGITVETLEPFRKLLDKTVEGARAAGTLDGWQARQVYIALGQFLAATAVLGLDASPLEGLSPAKYDEILGLAGSGYATLAAVAVGRRAADDKYATTPKVRFAHPDVIVQV